MTEPDQQILDINTAGGGHYEDGVTGGGAAPGEFATIPDQGMDEMSDDGLSMDDDESAQEEFCMNY